MSSSLLLRDMNILNILVLFYLYKLISLSCHGMLPSLLINTIKFLIRATDTIQNMPLDSGTFRIDRLLPEGFLPNVNNIEQ